MGRSFGGSSVAGHAHSLGHCPPCQGQGRDPSWAAHSSACLRLHCQGVALSAGTSPPLPACTHSRLECICPFRDQGTFLSIFLDMRGKQMPRWTTHLCKVTAPLGSVICWKPSPERARRHRPSCSLSPGQDAEGDQHTGGCSGTGRARTAPGRAFGCLTPWSCGQRSVLPVTCDHARALSSGDAPKPRCPGFLWDLVT